MLRFNYMRKDEGNKLDLYLSKLCDNLYVMIYGFRDKLNGRKLPKGGFELLVDEIESARLAYPAIPRTEKDQFFESTARVTQEQIVPRSLAGAFVKHYSGKFLTHLVNSLGEEKKPQVVVMPNLGDTTVKENLLCYSGLVIAVAVYSHPDAVPCEEAVLPNDLQQFAFIATMINPTQMCEGIVLK